MDEWAAHRREHKLEQDNVLLERTLGTRALDVAYADIDRRLGEMNHLRDQINAERARYITREEYEAKHEALIAKVATLETTIGGRMDAISARIGIIETSSAGLTGRLAALAAVAGAVVTVLVTVFVKFVTV